MVPNYDSEKGIHYGVIHTNDLDMEAVEDVRFSEHAKTPWGYQLDEIRDELKAVLQDVIREKVLTEIIEDVVDRINEDADVDDEGRFDYDDGKLAFSVDSYGDLMLFKSPFYCMAPGCSPCAPNAGHVGDLYRNGIEGKYKTYCLPTDWYGEKPKFKMYEVK